MKSINFPNLPSYKKLLKQRDMNKEKLKELRVKLVKNYKKDYPEGGFILPSWVAELVNIIDAILED